MPKRTEAEKLARKELMEQKREARRLKKLEKDQEKKTGTASVSSGGANVNNRSSSGKKQTNDGPCLLLMMPEDAMQLIMCFLPSADLGRFTMTCKQVNHTLPEARVPYTLSRLRRIPAAVQDRHINIGLTDLCSNQDEARQIIQQSYGGGDTGRVVPKKSKHSSNHGANDFVAYARFLEEAVNGYSTLTVGNLKKPVVLPANVQGRFVSASPEHSVCRVGGDGQKNGAGGSGVASWGVGKRGQLGHGKRQDEGKGPRMLLGGLGYGIRVVQVSAGGGLVRVAHTLLLTATGRVLSFGTGQYGALGHGYSAGKQLPDELRPKYIDALASQRCVCVAAGELHSAVVTADGDVYTWGDGFCGQLGHGDKRPQLLPKQVTKGDLEDECVASITCGSRHTLAVTEDGEVFSWGLGHFGVLGRSFTPFEYDADAAVLPPGVGTPAGIRETDNATAAIAGAGGIATAAPPLPMALASTVENSSAQQQQLELDNGDSTQAQHEQQQDQEVDLAAELLEHLNLITNLSLEDSSNQCIPMPVESLKGIRIVGASAGHRHSLILDENGCLYSFGAGSTGCLGHGDKLSQMHPVCVMDFVDKNIRIKQMSAGVDISMAVSITGDVYAWGKTDKGRIGLGLESDFVDTPKQIRIHDSETNETLKVVDVDCGYVHSLLVALNGTIHMCGRVGTDGQADGATVTDTTSSENQTQAERDRYRSLAGHPMQIPDFNIWHRLPEPKEKVAVKTERWKKFGKYEVKGRAKMMAEP